jgi:hypothetical protein
MDTSHLGVDRNGGGNSVSCAVHDAAGRLPDNDDFLAALLHILHGEFDIGVLLVYAMAVLVTIVYRSGAESETAHDGQRATERV